MELTAEQIIALFVLIVPLLCVGTGRLRPDLAAVLSAFALGTAQYAGFAVLGPVSERGSALRALSGLAQPVTVTLFSLFVLSRSLELSGVARFLAQRVVRLAGASESRLVGLLATTAAALSLFMNNLAAGSLVLPSAIEVSRRTGVRASKLLLPIAYGTCLGGAATYFTTTNIVASNMLLAAHPPQTSLGVLDFTPAGGLVAVCGILFLWLVGHRFLPSREASAEQRMARRTGSELERAYHVSDGQWEIVIPEGSPYSGQPLSACGIGERFGLTVLAITRAARVIVSPTPDEILQCADRLLVVSSRDRVEALSRAGFELQPECEAHHLTSRGAHFSEVVLIPGSKAEGQTLRELSFRTRYGMSVVALHREGKAFQTDLADMPLRQGDSLLAMGGDDRVNLLRVSSDFLLIEADPRDLPVDWPRANRAIVIAVIAVGASICGMPVFLATLGAAIALLLLGVINIDQAYRSMEWQALFLVAGMFPVSVALVYTGLALQIGEIIVHMIGPYGALALIAGAYAGTALLAQALSGPATVIIAAPIFISAAIQLGTNPQAIAVTVAIACSTCFLTPLSHPVVTLMMGPGNYSFGDFFRAGWLLSLVCFLSSIVGVSVFWSL